MSWLASILIGILTATLGLLLTGVVANAAVGWYRISSFEGGSGYFVVFLALFGGIVGLVVGIGAARLVPAGASLGFLKGLTGGIGTMLVLIGGIGGTARLLADIPPEIDGETLFLAVELKWPAADTTDPRTLPGVGLTNLRSVSRMSRIARVSEAGPFFVEDAKQVDGRWLVPGVVRIFTSRGQRALDFSIGEKSLGGFLVPLPGHPGKDLHEWSQWYPRAREGSPPLPDQFTYRFRVIRQSEPIRTDAIGPFTITTIAGYFFREMGTERLAASSFFRIEHGGTVIPGFAESHAVSVLGGKRVALLAHGGGDSQSGTCHVLADDGGQLKDQSVGGCYAPLGGRPLTADSAAFRTARATVIPRGWIDWTTFAAPGLYQVQQLFVDTRDLTAGPLGLPTEPFPIDPPGLITVSPDERSVVWFGRDGSEDKPVLGVTDFRAKHSYTLPIDRPRMRFAKYELIDPAWVDHHFTWERGKDGFDRLVERKAFVPLAYRGERALNKPGEYQAYTLQPGGERLRTAIVDLIVSELHGERLPDELSGFQKNVRVDGETFGITMIDSGPYVSISTYHGDPKIMAGIADRLDALLATGRFDDLFGR